MGQELRERGRPLPRSVQPLVEIAVHDAGAAGYALYEIDPVTSQRVLKLTWGVPAPLLQSAGFTVASFSLDVGDKVGGVLAFIFRGSVIPEASRIILGRIARAIEAVWRLTLVPSDYARNAARVGEMELDLADSKIADRARGMLAGGSLPADALETIMRHVETVLRPGQLRTVIAQLTEQAEQEIAERELASRAKEVLQSRYGMSEDQAHAHLRVVSRKSRKRLRDVAREILQDQLGAV